MKDSPPPLRNKTVVKKTNSVTVIVRPQTTEEKRRFQAAFEALLRELVRQELKTHGGNDG